jgi:hypothetical protein
MLDGNVKRPISTLRFIATALRRTRSTPRKSSFARLELELFPLPSQNFDALRDLHA